MAGFEWWTGSFSQWLFVCIPATVLISAAVLAYFGQR